MFVNEFLTLNTKCSYTWKIYGEFRRFVSFRAKHRCTGRTKLGGRKEILPDFGLCSSCQKKFSGETFQNCCGRGGRSDYEKFLIDSIFPTKLTEFPTKLTECVPFIFIISQYCLTVKRILPDWLCLPNKLGGGGLPPPLPPPPAWYAHGAKALRLQRRAERIITNNEM
jgi:hypothetical protein